MQQMHLPTEILIIIVSFLAADVPDSQRTLHSCCLVSRQWYSASVSFLYENPQLGYGKAFTKFTETVCPPISARKSKYNLGGFVRRLDLGHLVHHSSPSLTARLLGRVKDNLEVFIAPSISFSSNSLPALSKCHNLRSLDLALVGDKIHFPRLKKALRNLTKLTTLRLPRSTNLSAADPSDSDDWPPFIQHLQLAGTFSPTAIPSFTWPPNLTKLSLLGCNDLSVTSISCLLSSPQLGARLKRLAISNYNHHLQPESINAIPAFLPGLTLLCIPGDLVEDSFFDILSYMSPPLALEILQFGHPYSFTGSRINFSTAALVQALHGGLANLRGVGFAEVFLTEQRILEDEEIDEVLQKRARGGVEAGVYYV